MDETDETFWGSLRETTIGMSPAEQLERARAAAERNYGGSIAQASPPAETVPITWSVASGWTTSVVESGGVNMTMETMRDALRYVAEPSASGITYGVTRAGSPYHAPVEEKKMQKQVLDQDEVETCIYKLNDIAENYTRRQIRRTFDKYFDIPAGITRVGRDREIKRLAFEKLFDGDSPEYIAEYIVENGY